MDAARPALFALALAAAGPALPDAVSPAAFEAMAEGRTLHFTLAGEPYGSEQYFPGRRSLWRVADGTCQRGVWRAEGELVCFAYEGNPLQSCWRLLPRPAGFAAALVEAGAETGLVVELSHVDTAPLACPGPDVGS